MSDTWQPTFPPGTIVQMRPEIAARHYPAYQGRHALVERSFARIGRNDQREAETVRLQWLHRKTGKPLKNVEFFAAAQMEPLPPPPKE
jgi:hypothetical protein